MSDSEEGYETSDYTSDEEPVPAKPAAKPVVATKPATAPQATKVTATATTTKITASTTAAGSTAAKTTTTTTTATTTKTVVAAKQTAQKAPAKKESSEDSEYESEEEEAPGKKAGAKETVAPKATETKKVETKKVELKKVEPKKEEPKKEVKKEAAPAEVPKEEPKEKKEKKTRSGSEVHAVKPLSIPLKDREEYFKVMESIENEHAIRYQIHMTYINDRTKIVNNGIDMTIKRTKLFIDFLNKKLDYCRKVMDVAKTTQKLFEPYASPTIGDKEAKELKEKAKNDSENPQQLPDDWADPTFIALFDYFEDCEFEIQNQYYEAYKRYEPLCNETMKNLLNEYKDKTSDLVNDAKKIIAKFEAFNKAASTAFDGVRSTYRHILAVGVDGRLSGRDLYRDVVKYSTALNQADQSLTFVKEYFDSYIDKFSEIDTQHYTSYMEHTKYYFNTEFLVINGIYGPVAPYEEFFKAFDVGKQMDKTKTEYNAISEKYLPDELTKLQGAIVDETPDIINNPYLKMTTKVKYNTKNGWVDNYAVLTVDNHIILYNVTIDDPTNPESVIQTLTDIRGEPVQYFRMNMTSITEGSKGSDGAIMEFEEQVKKFGLFKSTVKNLIKFSSVEVRSQWMKQINEYKDKAGEEVD